MTRFCLSRPFDEVPFYFIFPRHSHIERAVYGDPFDGSYNITGPQMVLVMKLTTFAWNVWDGRRPSEVPRSFL